jgi:hypothetical protein
MLHLNIMSVRVKKSVGAGIGTPFRKPFMVLGVFKSMEAFRQAMRDDIDTDDYDLRTIKTHESFGFPGVDDPQPRIVELDSLSEDLL